MFLKCLTLSNILLFTLVYCIACAAETDTNQPATARPSATRRKTSFSNVNGNIPKADSDYIDILGIDAPSHVVDGPEIKSSKRAGRTKRTPSTTSPSINKKTSIPKSDVQNPTRPYRSQPAKDNDISPEDYNSFSETNEPYPKNPQPEQPSRVRPSRTGRIASEINGDKRIPKKANSATSTTSAPQNEEVLIPGLDLFSSPNNDGNILQNYAENPQFVESYPKNKETDTTAQNKFNDDWMSFGGSTHSILETYSNEQPEKMLESNNFSPDGQPQTFNGYDYTMEKYKIDELNQLPIEPVIMSIFKIIMNALEEMFLNLKKTLQRPV